MTISSLTSKIILRLLLPVSLTVLCGCQNPSPRISEIGVFSPPDPLFGSVPIAAYDEFALALKPQVGVPRNEKMILFSAQ